MDSDSREFDCSAMLDHLVHKIFGGVLGSDPPLIEAISHRDSSLTVDVAGELSFTLLGLYSFLEDELHQPPTPEGFRQFRRALYRSGVNAELAAIGAAVVVDGVSADPALRRYRLRRLLP